MNTSASSGGPYFVSVSSYTAYQSYVDLLAFTLSEYSSGALVRTLNFTTNTSTLSASASDSLSRISVGTAPGALSIGPADEGSYWLASATYNVSGAIAVMTSANSTFSFDSLFLRMRL